MGSNAIIEKLCSNVLNTRFENLERKTVEHAKNRIIDTVGCIIGGANGPCNSALLELIVGWGGRHEATILVHGYKVPVINAVMANAIMARSYDFEPVDPTVADKSVPGHVSGTTVPTAIGVGELMGVDGKEMITALIIGDDITARMHAASFFDITQCWDSVGVMNPFGATAIAGRLLGLDKQQLKNAFGLVLHQLGGSFQHLWDFTIAFKLTQGLAARNGVFSALLAKKGWAGAEDPFTGKFGYFNTYCKGMCDPSTLVCDLGKNFYSDSGFKAYPCCFLLHPAIECALNLAQEKDVEPNDVEEVIVYVPMKYVDAFQTKPFKIGYFPQVNAAFSFRYTVATALIRRSLCLEHFIEDSIHDPEVNALTEKVKFVGESDMPYFKAKLEVKLKDGRILSKHTEAHKGFRLNPMSKEEIINKFWKNVRFSKTVKEEQAKELLNNLKKLEECRDIRSIVEQCTIKNTNK
jgi:2-methylcitrate dehydratase PrpD